MIDPLSFTASILAVIGTANFVVKSADTLYRISRDAGSMAEDVEFFASHIATFGSIVSSVARTLRDHFDKHSDSLTLDHMHKHNTLEGLQRQVRHLMQRVKHLRPRRKAREVVLHWKARLRWVWQKSQREELCLWIDRVKDAFLLVMLQVMYEALDLRASESQSISSREIFRLQNEIRDHKSLMATHIKAIHVLKDRLDSHSGVRTWYNKEDSANGYNSVEDTILDFGKHTIRNTGYSLNSPRKIRSSDGYGRRSTGGIAQDETREISSRPVGPGQPVLHNQIERSDVPEMRPSSTSNVPSRNPAIHEDTYLSVEPSQNSLFCNPQLNIDAIDGYVSGIHTSAILNKAFPENVISTLRASQLGLVMDEVEEDSQPRDIDFGLGHRELVRGSTTLEWKESVSSHLRPFKVACNVCNHTPHPLIFGQRFLRKREHYWRKPYPSS